MSECRRPRMPRVLHRLAGDQSGVQFMEFALVLPFFFMGFGAALEDYNYAVVSLQLSKHALDLADAAARVGQNTGSSGVVQLHEADINDVLIGSRLQGQKLKLTTYGRVILSSLENVRQKYDSAAEQRVHWQRCIGLGNFVSSDVTPKWQDGTTDSEENKGVAVPNGMGDANAKVKAPADSGVMYVEIRYVYQPIFGSLFSYVIPNRNMRYTASFLVRDNRVYTHILNPETAPVSRCIDKTT